MRKVKVSLYALASMALFSCGGGGSNVFESLADKNSYEACRFEVSQNLDKGNYDAVLRSPCANALDRGAAYFGKAGFDVKDVIDRLIEQQGSGNTADAYIRALVPQMDPDRFNFLNLAAQEYRSLSADRDAQFYLSLVSAMQALATMRSTIGEIRTECDINQNRVPDDVDATACMLDRSGNISPNSTGMCGVANGRLTYSTSATLSFSIDTTGTNYLGMVVSFPGSQQGCSSSYKKLYYYQTSTGSYLPATTAGFCKTDGTRCTSEQEAGCWPCPVPQQRDLVQTIQNNLDEAVNLIVNLLGNQNPDLRRSIEELRTEVCGQDRVCTESEIRQYINNIQIRR